MGLVCRPENVLTSGEATARYLVKQKKKPRVYLVGTPELVRDFERFGIILTTDRPDYVVLGFDTTLTYGKLATACHLIRSGVPFIATHPDFNCPTETGYIPDCGAMTALIHASTGVSPHVIGKPSREIVDMVLAKKPYRPCQVAIVGDRLYTDIAAGANAGIHTMLVLSGETKSADLGASPVKPDYIFANLAALLAAVRESDQGH